MVPRVDWQTTGDSLKEQPEQSGKTRPYSLDALEKLAIKAFGDMGHGTDGPITSDSGFIAGHSNCDLCRHFNQGCDAVFGKATPTWQFAGLVSQIQIRRIRHMPSAIQTATMRPQGWQWSTDRDQARNSWMTC